LADVSPGLVSDIVRALRVEGANFFAETFESLLFHGLCPSRGLPCLVTAPTGTPSPAMTDVEVDGEPIALLYLDVDDASGAVTAITHVGVVDRRDLGAPA
jgi:hypothetical protein